MSINTAKLKKRFFRLKFYLRHGILSLKPRAIGQQQLKKIFKYYNNLPQETKKIITQRVNYYLKKPNSSKDCREKVKAKDFHLKGHNTCYYFDMAILLPYFSQDASFSYEFGDVTTVPDCPTIVKSRPISDDNQNSILLKLNSIRHFCIPKDVCQYDNKKPLLVWRGAAHQAQRIRLLESYAGNPTFDLGCVADSSLGKPYHANFLGINKQLQYQFILSIEGNDVATNLKWIMASNSLCFMTKPKYETWFMEGCLVPNYHYVLLKDDYSDLEEKVAYYQKNPLAAKSIIANAQGYVEQFFNHKQELLIQLLVLSKYFNL